MTTGEDNTKPSISYSRSSYQLSKGVEIPSIAPSVTGNPFTSCVSSPNLPQGLSIDDSNCVISGIPTAIQDSTDYTITVKNDHGEDSTEISISITETPPSSLSYLQNDYIFTNGVAIPAITPSYVYSKRFRFVKKV